MRLLGLRLSAHDSNVTYYDGEQLRYTNLERDYQIKHFGFDSLYNWTSVLEKWNIIPSEVDAICIVEDTPNSHGRTEELIEIPIFRDIGFVCPIHRIDHHYAHTLSFWPLGVKPNLHFVFDGFGDDYIYRSIWRDNKLVDCRKTNSQMCKYAPSLGFIMTRIGALLQMGGHYLDQAGKVMALKAYGSHCPVVPESFSIDGLNEIWNFDILEKNINDRWFVMDYIATAHEYTEQVFLNHFLEHVREGDVVGYSGGIAQNILINTKLREHIPNLFIPPHANDSGLSLGCIEYLRSTYSLDDFDISGFPFWDGESPKERPSDKTIKDTAESLAYGKIVGWYQGAGEIGPRALGNRSILMSPFVKGGKDYINEKVKHRESYRPFGASVLEEKVSEHFDWEGESPYMLYNSVVKGDVTYEYDSIKHKDRTCRHQTVSEDHEDYYRLIKEFEMLTGLPILLNTSLNNAGKPIAGRIPDALQLYYESGLDVLVSGNEIWSKS